VPRFLRFCVVGGLCTLLNLGVFYWLIGKRHWPTWAATIVAFVVVNAVGYWLNKHYTFRRRETPIPREAARYYLIMVASLAANLTAMWLLVDVARLHYLLASLLLTIAFTVLNFTLQRRYTFRSSSDSAPDAPDVLLATHYYPAHGGGVEIVAGELACRLAAPHGRRIEWWASATDVSPVCEGLSTRPVRAWNGAERHLGLPVPIWSPAALMKIASRARHARLIHVHDLLYPGNCIAALSALVYRRPLIVTQHLSVVPYRSRWLRVLMRAVTRLVVVPILERATQVVFIADSARQYFDLRCRWRRAASFIANGVDLSLYRAPSDAERDAARQAVLGDERHVRMVLFVGRFVEKKGLTLLREVAASLPLTTFVFAGSGVLDPQHWQLPNVHVCRGRSGVGLRELYWAADTLALPSVGEGFPLVVQEGLASGLAAVVSPEVAAGSAICGAELLIEELGDAACKRWRARLQAACADESAARRSHLAAFAATHWSWDVTADAYAQLYTTIQASLPAA
jgi:glycosyltransferase involved in cell wall biosynthesis/putative flippase GtrA